MKMSFRFGNLSKSIAFTIGAIITLFLGFACICVTFNQPTFASNKISVYYAQLDAQSQKFYDALLDMYNKGSLKTGTVEYDLIDKDVVTAEQTQQYASGDNKLITSFERAKYAFMLDFNVFYVDFSKLQLSFGIKDNKYVATLGSGRNNNYFASDFTNETEVETAISQYKTALQTLVNFAKSGETIEQKINLINTKILENTTFGYGISVDTSTSINASQSTTNYGALCNGIATYEGFARLYRDVLNELDIQNILVDGYILNKNENFSSAMWNYVEIGNVWYAINAGLNRQSTNASEYLLVGQNQMQFRHYICTPCGFVTPELSKEAYNFVADVNVNTVITDKMTLSTSYLGKNATTLATENNLYLALRTSESEFDSNERIWKNWVSMSVAKNVESSGYTDSIVDIANETAFVVPNQVKFVQIAVINIAPPTSGIYSSVESENIVSISVEFINQKNEKFSPAPTAKGVIPANTQVLDVDKTYTIVIEYDEPLTKLVQNEPIGVIVSSSRDAKEYSIQNVMWNDKQSADTISFSFTASPLFNDNFQTYSFEVENLIGSKSKKAPNMVSYNFQKYNVNLSQINKKQSNLNTITLSDDNYLDLTGWTFRTNAETIQSANNELYNQLAFVSSSLNTDLTQSILNKILSKNHGFGSKDVFSSQGYDFNLSLCGGQVAFMNGKMLKISTKIANNNAIYKAYLCTRDDGDNLELDKVSEVKSFQTDDELIMELNKFGSLVILELNRSAVNTSARTIYINNVNGNGVVSAKINGLAQTDIIALKLNESVIIEFSPITEYKLATCQINGKLLTVEDNKVIISFNDIYTNNCLDVCFVASRVANYENTIGLTNLQSDYLSNQYAHQGINWGLWLCVGICVLVILTLLILWLIVVIRNKKQDSIARG